MSKAPGGITDALSFFEEEIKSDDQQIRLHAVQKINVIAHCIGPEKTVSELLPLLFDLSKQEQFLNDDEFLFRLAEQYSVLLSQIKGSYTSIIPQIEWLAYQEETVIRDKAVEVLGIICSLDDFTQTGLSDDIMPALKRLASAEWFTARLSVCALFQHAYPKAPENLKQELRKLYAHLAADETPMVRRAAALRLKEFCKVVGKEHLSDILPVYRQLSQDDTQDIIRVACVHTSLVLIEQHFKDNPEENKTHTLLVLTAATEDRSWRVRLTVAQNFSKIVESLGSEMTNAFLMTPFVNLMKDSEQEVRAAAVSVIKDLCNSFSIEQLQNYIVPQFSSITMDPSQMVRAALGGVISTVAKKLDKEFSQKHLLTNISDLMKDEAHEVRLQIVSNAADICVVLGKDVVIHSLLGVIQGLIMDNQWRIRKSVIEQMPELARKFGQEFFETKLESIIFSSLSDSVHAVRFAALKNVGTICQHFGREWTTNHVLNKVTDQYNETSGFSTRITILHTLPEIAQVMNQDQIQSHLLPILKKGLNDSVPNVRYCACKKLSEPMSNHFLTNDIRADLERLKDDTDPDVQQLAKEVSAIKVV